jgi:hypothetical protein
MPTPNADAVARVREVLDDFADGGTALLVPEGVAGFASAARALLAHLDALTAENAGLRKTLDDWEQSAIGYRKSSEEWQRRCNALTAEVAGLRSLVQDVSHSALEFDDPRIGYVVAQVDRSTWNDVQAAARSGR